MLFHVMVSVFMYDPQGDSLGTPRKALEAVLNRCAELRDIIWHLGVFEDALLGDGVTFHV